MITAWPAYDVAGHHGNNFSGAAAGRQSGTCCSHVCMHAIQAGVQEAWVCVQPLVAIYALEHVPAHLAMMPYALKALGYFLGTPGARFPSDCILTCKVTAVLCHSGNHEAAQQMTGLRC